MGPRTSPSVDDPPASYRWVAPLAVCGVLLVLGFQPLLTPPALPATDPDGIDMEAAIGHVEAIAERPRPMGSEAIRDVRSYLVGRLEQLGLEPVVQESDAPDWFGVPGSTVEIANVMARIEGSGSGDALVFLAHYDTVPGSAGANDDAAGVAALLEVARRLVAEPPLRNDIIILFTDAEEPQPRFGASAFTRHPWFADVVLAVNLEGIGEVGPSMLVEVNGPTAWMIAELRTAVAAPAAFSFLDETVGFIGGSTTDFDVFRSTGVPGFDFAYARGSTIYHTDADVPGALHVDGLAHNAALSLGIARHFGGLDWSQLPDDEPAVFFTLPGRVLVSHSEGWLWPALVLGLIGSGVGLLRRARERSAPRGVGAVAAGAVGVALLVILPWTAVVSLRPEMGVWEFYAYGLAVVGSAVAMWLGVWRLAHRWAADVVAGTFIIWTVIAVAVVVAAPAWGYFLVWTYAAGGVAVALSRTWRRSPAVQLTSLVIVALPTFLMILPVGDVFLTFAGPRPGNPGSEVQAAIALVAAVSFLAVALIGSVLDPWFTEPAGGERAGTAEPGPVVRSAELDDPDVRVG